jgi:hypothetical protein
LKTVQKLMGHKTSAPTPPGPRRHSLALRQDRNRKQSGGRSLLRCEKEFCPANGCGPLRRHGTDSREIKVLPTLHSSRKLVLKRTVLLEFAGQSSNALVPRRHCFASPNSLLEYRFSGSIRPDWGRFSGGSTSRSFCPWRLRHDAATRFPWPLAVSQRYLTGAVRCGEGSQT